MQSRSIETDHVRPRQGEWSYVARNPWAALGALLIITGTIGSIVAANGVARSANQQSQKEFVASGTQVAATLKLAIQHEEDFVVSLQAFFLTNPHATETQLLKWSVDVRALERYPEIQQVGNVVLVPASALGAYGSTVGKSVPFQLVPPGSRPFYCFGALGFARAAVKGATAGFDFCASPPGQ